MLLTFSLKLLLSVLVVVVFSASSSIYSSNCIWTYPLSFNLSPPLEIVPIGDYCSLQVYHSMEKEKQISIDPISLKETTNTDESHNFMAPSMIDLSLFQVFK